MDFDLRKLKDFVKEKLMIFYTENLIVFFEYHFVIDLKVLYCVYVLGVLVWELLYAIWVLGVAKWVLCIGENDGIVIRIILDTKKLNIDLVKRFIVYQVVIYM